MAGQMQALNGMLLAHAEVAVKLLDRAASETDQVAIPLKALVSRLEEVAKSQPGIRPSQFQQVILERIDQHKKQWP